MTGPIEREARLIEATAGSITGDTWARDILTRCQMMREAIDRLEREAEKRLPGER